MERWEKEQREYRASLTEILLDKPEVNWYEVDGCVNVERVVIGKKVKKITPYTFTTSTQYVKCHKIRAVEIQPGNDRFVLDGDCLIQKKENEMVLCFGVPHIPEYLEDVHLSCYTSTETAPVFRIPKGLKDITQSNRSFSIASIELEEGNEAFELESGCLFKKGGDTIVLGCESSVIPARARKIGRSAFSGCKIEEIAIPPTVEVIEEECFYGCPSLARVSFCEGLTEIGKYAFAHCGSLNALRLPDSLKKVGEGAFIDCSGLKTIENFGGIREISRRCFERCGFQSLTIPGSIGAIEDDMAFWGCAELKTVVLENGVKVLGESAFGCCEKLETAVLADTVHTLGERAFEDCKKLKSVNLPEGIKVLPPMCFDGCKSLKEIAFPQSLERIETWAFHNCSGLEQTNLNELENLKKAIKDAFAGCRKLKDRGIAAKKVQPLDEKFYSMGSYEDTLAETKPGETLMMMRLTLSDLFMKFQAGTVLDGKKYLYVTKKDEKYFVEISDKQQMDELAGVYEVYVCHTVSKDSPLYEKLKTAFGLTE